MFRDVTTVLNERKHLKMVIRSVPDSISLFLDRTDRPGLTALHLWLQFWIEATATCFRHLAPPAASDPIIISGGEFAGIRTNIWNQAKVRHFLTYSLAGGGNHNLGYHALRWEMILHGNAGEMGKYAMLSVLPDTIARFLWKPWYLVYPFWLGVMSMFTASSDQIR